MLEKSVISTHSSRTGIATDISVAVALEKPASQLAKHHSQSTFHM